MNIAVDALNSISDVYRVARETQGMATPGELELTVPKWKRWLAAEESPIRVFELRVRMEDVPYWVHVHLVRHKIGCEWFVRTQRPDSHNPVNYDRRKAPQDALVDLTLVCNPQSLINISRKRLCSNASEETKLAWRLVRDVIRGHENPYIAAIAGYMMADCDYRGGWCYMVKSCGQSPRANQ